MHWLRSAVEQFGCSGRAISSFIAEIGLSPLNRTVMPLQLSVGAWLKD
jgi:hypothetical protein